MDEKELRDEFLAALSGAGQGASMDLGDEIYGAARGGIDSLRSDGSFRDAYQRRRDEARGYLKGMEEKYPIAYGAGDIAGSMLPIPGAGPIGLGKPLLERAAKAAIQGGISGFGRSEGESAGDLLADTATGAASGAGSTLAFDQLMHHIGDVIDFKKMKKLKDKARAEGIAKSIDVDPRLTEHNWNKLDKEVDGINAEIDMLNPSDPDYNQMLEKRISRLKEIEKIADGSIEAKGGPKAGSLSGSLGKTNKERMAENNKRAMRESGLSKTYDFPDEEIRAKRPLKRDEEVPRLDRIKEMRLAESKAEPEELGIWDRIMSRFDDDDKGGNELKRLMKNVDEKGADEPYVGRDSHGVMGVENFKNKKYPQPLPVPLEKIGDLKGVLGKGVLKGDSDPFGWMDTKYGVGKGLLEREQDKPLKIYTRSDLIAHDDYLEHINPKLHEVNIVIGTPSDRISRMIEGGAPSIKRRIQAANKLAESGVKVNFVYQTFDNPSLSDEYKSIVQPPIMDALRSLRESGLDPSIKVIEEKTPIADKNAQVMMKMLFGQ